MCNKKGCIFDQYKDCTHNKPHKQNKFCPDYKKYSGRYYHNSCCVPVEVKNGNKG